MDSFKTLRISWDLGISPMWRSNLDHSS
jgi:hypothetical protein